MSEKYWGIVLRKNGILCGWHPEEEDPSEFVLDNGKTVTIPPVTDVAPATRAYYPGTLDLQTME